MTAKLRSPLCIRNSRASRYMALDTLKMPQQVARHKTQTATINYVHYPCHMHTSTFLLSSGASGDLSGTTRHWVPSGERGMCHVDIRSLRESCETWARYAILDMFEFQGTLKNMSCVMWLAQSIFVYFCTLKILLT